MNMNPHAVEARARRERTANYLARGATSMRRITSHELARRESIDIQAAQKDLRALEAEGRIARAGVRFGGVVWRWLHTPV